VKEKILTYAGPRKLDGARSASNAFVIAPPNSRTPHGTFPLQALAERLARPWFAIRRRPSRSLSQRTAQKVRPGCSTCRELGKELIFNQLEEFVDGKQQSQTDGKLRTGRVCNGGGELLPAGIQRVKSAKSLSGPIIFQFRPKRRKALKHSASAD
jgi:hypothetical protein